MSANPSLVQRLIVLPLPAGHLLHHVLLKLDGRVGGKHVVAGQSSQVPLAHGGEILMVKGDAEAMMLDDLDKPIYILTE